MTELPSTRIFVAGATGSGKTHVLRRLVIPRCPRRILVDFLGEWERQRSELKGRVVIARSIEESRRALREVAGYGEWSVIVQLAPDEFPPFARILLPSQFSDETPIYSRAVRGCALVCDELDLIASHSADADVLALWRRGRHVGLTIAAATQTPTSVHPLVRGMSRYLVLCQMHENNSVAYFRAAVPGDVLERLTSLPPREALVYDAHQRTALHLSADFVDSAGKKGRILWRFPAAVLLERRQTAT